MRYTINEHFRIKAEQTIYPCGKNMITLFHDDILTQQKNGKWTKHTGLCRYDIEIPEDEVEKVLEPIHLEMTSFSQM